MKFEGSLLLVLIIFLIPFICHGENVSPVSDDYIIENYLNNLDKGKLIFKPPLKMVVNTTELVTANITKENLSIGEDIEVAPFMDADLKGEPVFDIKEYIEVDSQVILNKGNATWKWDVTPKVVGNHTLQLFVYILIPLHNGITNKILTREKLIHIEVNPKEIQRQEEISNQMFWSNIISLVVWVLFLIEQLFTFIVLAMIGIFGKDIRKLTIKWINKKLNLNINLE